MAKDYTLLVIDDDPTIHIMMNKYLGEEYNIVNANTAQEGINKLSEEKIHFILSDIHMPGMTGLDFLEALVQDADFRNIPILIMTSLPSVQKQQKALNLGAADFIDKAVFANNKDKLLNRVRMKLVTNVDIPELPEELQLSRKEIIKQLLFDVSSGDFVTTTQKLCRIVANKLQADHLSFWTIHDENVQMLLSLGVKPLHKIGPEDLLEENVFQQVLSQKRPYLHNNIFSSEEGVFTDISKKEGLPAEIGIPLFALNEKQLIKNNMKIPPNTPLFGYVVLKRKKVFTSKEYKLTSKLLIQMGTILWRLYKNL